MVWAVSASTPAHSLPLHVTLSSVATSVFAVVTLWCGCPGVLFVACLGLFSHLSPEVTTPALCTLGVLVRTSAAPSWVGRVWWAGGLLRGGAVFGQELRCLAQQGCQWGLWMHGRLRG